MSRQRILITEDEVVVAEDLRTTLTGLGYEVTGIAGSKREALEMAEQTHPDLVLMDIKLKGEGDGIGAATEISERHNIPVVFLTAHADGGTLTRAAEALPFGYVLKPFEEHGLRASIETALRLHEAQAALSRMERWLATTLHSIGDAVVSLDLEGGITFMNPRCEQITGWSRIEAVGRPFGDIFRFIDETTRQPIENPALRAMKLGVQLNVTAGALLISRTGAEIPIDDSAAPIRESDGSISGAVFVFRDASQSREQAEERERLQKRMLDAQRLESLSLVVGGVAHDFNNLLTAILGNAQLARTILPENSMVAPLLEGIEEASTRAGELCMHMLAYAGRQETVLSAVDLNDLVVRTAQMIRNSLHPNAELVLELEPHLPPVKADRTQIQQAVMNLVVNGAEALCAARGVVTIASRKTTLEQETLRDASLGDEWEPGPYVKLEVRDTGCGMSAETIGRIFDPFFTTKFTGRGLGLASVHGIARSHKAPVFVRSRIGFGSTFEIFLPIEAPQPVMAQPPAKPVRIRGEGPVLIVEDEPTVLSIVTRIVNRLGFQSIPTNGGEAALATLASRTEMPKLVLLDANMPGMDGLATLRALRKTLPDTPVMLVSALPEEAAIERFAGEKIAAVLRKPFRPDQLERKIAEVLG
jgi:two-component system cell cycle sensor histidine kinase/response regulator CckA